MNKASMLSKKHGFGSMFLIPRVANKLGSWWTSE